MKRVALVYSRETKVGFIERYLGIMNIFHPL